MWHLLTLFLISWAQVFVLAFQSKSINGGHYLLAAIGSIAIGFSNVYLWRAFSSDTAGFLEILVYSLGGSVGVLTAMFTHGRMVKPKQ